VKQEIIAISIKHTLLTRDIASGSWRITGVRAHEIATDHTGSFFPVSVIGLWLAPLALAVMLLPDIVAYVAIHLRYDTTWYVLTHKSLRIRRGIWVIQESTITFENIQNISVEFGPLERWFGIANVIVDTAGGGPEKTSHGKPKENFHRGISEGIDHPDEIRDLIMNRLRQSRSAGLGDDHATATAWGTQHVAILREIRDSLQHPGGVQAN
jgi:hypothetical protein